MPELAKLLSSPIIYFFNRQETMRYEEKLVLEEIAKHLDSRATMDDSMIAFNCESIFGHIIIDGTKIYVIHNMMTKQYPMAKDVTFELGDPTSIEQVAAYYKKVIKKAETWKPYSKN